MGLLDEDLEKLNSLINMGYLKFMSPTPSRVKAGLPKIDLRFGKTILI